LTAPAPIVHRPKTPMAKAKTTQEGEPAFEEILTRLQGVVERLERGDLPLEDSLAMFEEGVRLSRLGSKRLDEAERRVEVLLRDEDGVRTRPLDEEESP
jgi:exodeoxyribonuclease VII small subunit